MAITKIHPIKTTVNLSIDYICDPAKTDEEILISSHACGYKTAALQFQNTKETKNSQCKNLARHLIQSFMPGEVNPGTAHQIGQDLCTRHLKSNYQYVLTTHVDKGHIHNHIIFNNVSHIDGKAYISNKKTYHQIRNTSDELCRMNGLSIADETTSSPAINKTKGKSYKEYQERKSGNSYKAKLQYAIDAAIRKAKDWDNFLKILQESGYEIKRGKHISFRAVGQERFTRSKTIGDDYTEEQIVIRIDLTKKSIQHNKSTQLHSSGKIIDISTNQLAQESMGFARWLKLQNLKNMAKSWNEITDNSITNIDTFYKYVNQVHDELGQTQNEIKIIESQTQAIGEMIKNINTYNNYKTIYSGYQNSTNKDAFFRTHESKIILFEAAREALGKKPSPLLPSSISEEKEKLATLSSKYQNLKTKLIDQQETVSKINQLRSNLEVYMKSAARDNKEKAH